MDPVSLLGGVIIGIAAIFFPAYTCEKALEHYQQEMPRLQAELGKYEQELRESKSTIARLEHENRMLGNKNSTLLQENHSFREQLEAALMQHHVLSVSQARVSKDTQAEMEDLRKWADRELQKRQDLVDDTNIARWHEKTEYAKKLVEYQRLLRKAVAESGGLSKALATERDKATRLQTERDKALRDLDTAQKNLATLQKDSATDLATEKARHQQEIKIYWRFIGGLALALVLALVALTVSLRGRSRPQEQ